MSNLSTLPKGDSAWLLRKAIERIIQQVSVLETNIGSSTTGNSTNTQVIFNDNGTLRGDAAFTFVPSTDILTVTGFKTFGTTQLSTIGILYVGTIGTPKLKVDVAGTGITTITQADITGALTVDTSTLKVDSTNHRVGVGTASPATILDIQSAGSVFARIYNTTSTVDAYLLVKNGTGEGFFGINATGPYIYTAGSLPITFTTASLERYRIASDGIATWSNVGGVAGTAMTLNSTGLGIGASPAAKLHVTDTSVAAATALVRFVGQSNYNLDIQSVNNSVSTVGNRFNFNIGSAGGEFSFSNSGGTRMYLDQSGNVGIGVTPSATDSTYYQSFEIARVGQGLTCVKTAFTSTPNSWLSNNSYATYSAGTVWKYAVSSQLAAQYRLAGGEHQWYNAPSGTAGNAITFTQAMTLDASGNLLIKKTSVSASTLGCELTATGQINGASANLDNLNIFNTTAAVYRFYVSGAGTVFATNTVISAISDSRLKENVQDIDVGLAAILSLKPRKFDWKAGKGKDIKGDRGFIAQEFETVFPNLIDEWKDKAPEGEAPYKSVRQDLIPVLVKAIQELTARVQTLETR